VRVGPRGKPKSYISWFGKCEGMNPHTPSELPFWELES